MKFSPEFFLGSSTNKPLFFRFRSEKEGLLVEEDEIKEKNIIISRIFLSLKQLVKKKEKRYQPKKRKGCI